MQIYATLPFSGCSLLKAIWNFSSIPSHPHPQILYFTHSFTHSNVCGGGIRGGKLNQIKSRWKLHGARQKKHRSKRKGICYLTPALHLISPERLETISRLANRGNGGLQLSKKSMKTSYDGADSVSLNPVHLKWRFFLDTIRPQKRGAQHEKKRKEEAASAALVLIDIQAKEYSNVSKLCYLTWEWAEIRG